MALGAGQGGAGVGRGAVVPTAHPIHRSLTRSRLYLGVERPVIAIEGTIAAALVFGVGLSLLTVGLIVLVWLLVHPVMVWITGKEPQASEVFLRARRYADFYAPQSGLSQAHRRPRPSIPRAQ